MSNIYFEEFTLLHYRELLSLAKQCFTFCFYKDFESLPNQLLWRHDIDFSIGNALVLAEIEAENNIQSTYFLLLHSPFYNLMDSRHLSIIKQIIALGHDIGLHFDPGFYQITDGRTFDRKNNLGKEFDRNPVSEKSVFIFFS